MDGGFHGCPPASWPTDLPALVRDERFRSVFECLAQRHPPVFHEPDFFFSQRLYQQRPTCLSIGVSEQEELLVMRFKSDRDDKAF
jgi:hypothetical protein